MNILKIFFIIIILSFLLQNFFNYYNFNENLNYKHIKKKSVSFADSNNLPLETIIKI